MTLVTLFVLCRFVHFAAVMIMFGVGLFCALLSPQPLSPQITHDSRPLLISATWIAALSAGLLLAVQAGQMGEGWVDTYQPSIWLAVLSTTFGEVWRWHLALSVLSLFALTLPKLWQLRVLVLLSTLLLISLAFIGHAAMYQGVIGALHRFNHALHLLAAGYWFGSLLPLLICMRYLSQSECRRDAITTLVRFSSWGHGAVIIVVVTGIINNLMVLGHWPLDFDLSYQRLLAIKIALVALMVLVAVANRYVVVPIMRTNPKQAQRGVVIACWSEMALGSLVLLLVSLFATSAPV